MNIMLIGNGFDKQHGINMDFNVFVNSAIFKKEIGKTYSSFFKNSEYRKFSEKTKLWSEFENYIYNICKTHKVKQVHLVKKITYIFQKWLSNKKTPVYKINHLIQDIINTNDIQIIISLNYTNTAKIYSYKDLKNIYNNFKEKKFSDDSTKRMWNNFHYLRGKFINLHSYNKYEREIYAILGHDKSNIINKDIFIMQWNKKTKYNPKNLLLNSILNKGVIRKIVIYGYSFGESDKQLNNFFNIFLDRKGIIDCYYKGEIPKYQNIKYFLVEESKSS